MVLMTEQPPGLSPLSPPEQLTKPAKPARKDSSRGIQSTYEAENGGEEGQRRNGRSDLPLLSVSPAETELDLSDNRKKPPLMRFKAVEQHSLTPTDFETKFERKKSGSSQISKSNAHYHKLFKDINKDELLRQSYTCALQKDMLYQGKMFVSDNWICFHSKVFGDTKIVIPVLSVTLIKKTKTAILVPNALVLATTNERHVFVSFLSRDTTYKLLRSICVHLDGDNTGSSPVTSSAENSFNCTTSLPLDFSGDFSDLDGVVRQRRHDMLESSSSGSQTPDYEKMAEFPSLPDAFLGAVKNGEVAVHADVHLQTPSQKHGAHGAAHGAAHQSGAAKITQGVVSKEKPAQSMSLHTLLLVYLFLVSVLVLSSCYMAFKIVSLEQRLNSLGTTGEYPRSGNVAYPKSTLTLAKSQADFNAEMYGELSANLFKLDKIQRNLRKLLEET